MKNRGTGGPVAFDRRDFQGLFQALDNRGYRVFGPRIQNGALVYGDLSSVEDLPAGWGDEQAGGSFRLRRARPQALFDFSLGQHSWKSLLLLPRLRLLRLEAGEDRFHPFRPTPERAPAEARPAAFLGVRACDLAAIAIQDRICSGGEFRDAEYEARRGSALVLAVNCANPCGTCFCASMGTGPRATAGFDLALTEILEDGRHYFLAEPGTDRGLELLRDIKHWPASVAERRAADGIAASAAGRMGRALDTRGIKELLYRNLEHARWDEVAGRCLTCGNCTLVCPTCFCVDVEDFTSLDRKTAERVRSWYSCFSVDHSTIHGGAIRPSPKSRYRQWLTHKLASWIDQFGISGCVGCGRCITWCPVGIDITEEAAAIRAGDAARPPGASGKG